MEEKEVKKLPYEELEKVARHLSNKCIELEQQLESCQVDNIFKRIDFLFKVVELKNTFSEEFYNRCVKELEELLTIKVETKE
jgi:hypothetical protein